MKRSVSLIILVAGTLLASCSSLQTISFDQLQAADVSFPDAVRKVAVINNMPVLKTKDNHEILSSELEGQKCCWKIRFSDASTASLPT